MGKLVYAVGENTVTFNTGDRFLLHLAHAIAQKLGRGEGFMLTIENALATPYPRTGIWVGPSAHLMFLYEDVAIINYDATEVAETLRLLDDPLGLRLREESISIDIPDAL